jgi:coenzyme PQQ precursor peptide PqqA
MPKGAGGLPTLFLRRSIELRQELGYAQFTFKGALAAQMGETMTWTAPAFEEVCLNCEINSYASAKL